MKNLLTRGYEVENLEAMRTKMNRDECFMLDRGIDSLEAYHWIRSRANSRTKKTVKMRHPRIKPLHKCIVSSNNFKDEFIADTENKPNLDNSNAFDILCAILDYLGMESA